MLSGERKGLLQPASTQEKEKRKWSSLHYRVNIANSGVRFYQRWNSEQKKLPLSAFSDCYASDFCPKRQNSQNFRLPNSSLRILWLYIYKRQWCPEKKSIENTDLDILFRKHFQWLLFWLTDNESEKYWLQPAYSRSACSFRLSSSIDKISKSSVDFLSSSDFTQLLLMFSKLISENDKRSWVHKANDKVIWRIRPFGEYIFLWCEGYENKTLSPNICLGFPVALIVIIIHKKLYWRPVTARPSCLVT